MAALCHSRILSLVLRQMMTDIEIAREAAAKAQANEIVAKMIRSGGYDAWPNVQGALNAIQAVRQTESRRRKEQAREAA